ncbi:MAG TPA: aldehyde dehydrogenase EutE, partial [Thermoguttaceae bacterium]
MYVDEKLIRSVVEQVISRLGANGSGAHVGSGRHGRYGLFTDVNEAVTGARNAFEELSRRTLEERNR